MARSSGSTRKGQQRRGSSGRTTTGSRQSSGQSKAQSSNRSKNQSTTRSNSSSESMARYVTKITTDHEVIRRWAEERGAKPARVEGTGGNGDVGIIRLEFPGAPGARDEKLEEISWEDWFKEFDEKGLAFVYEETTASGQKSNFNKLVKRETVKAKAKSAHA